MSKKNESIAEIQYRVGDATAPEGEGNRLIVHICNDRGGWGRGFVVALSRRWPEPEAAYRRWYAERKTGDGFFLGAVQFVPVTPEIWVANLIGQHGYKTENVEPPVRYEAIRQGLGTVAAWAKEQKASVHMPRIGCGLAGGEWSVVAGIIAEQLSAQGIAVTVYDL